MNYNDYVDLHLTPRPKRIDLFGQCLIKSPDLIICTPDDNAWAKRAARELALCIHDKTGFTPRILGEMPEPRYSKPCVILISEQSREQYLDHFQDPFFDDFNLNPGFQAYRMRSMVGNRRILIQGLAEEGVFWGMKTLKQLMLVEKRMMVMPQAMIVDGADMEERGIWTRAMDMRASPYSTRAQTEKHFCEWIDWMSDHKLNLIEVQAVGECGGVVFKSKTCPEAACPDIATTESIMRRMIQYGTERGVRMIPIVSHTEHLGFISRKFPEVKAANATPHHGHSMGLPINYFNEKTGNILKKIVGEMVEAFNPREICFWMSENRLHPLAGAGQKKSYFMQEAKVFSETVEHVKQTINPNLKYRILLSQGSYPENLQLIHSLPKDVKWIFYSGERYGTYTIRPINPINADIAKAAQEGYWISFCNPIRGVPARPTVFDILHQNIGHAIKGGLKGVDGMSYAFPADKQALFITAQDTWNYQGRSLEESLTAYAATLQSDNPSAHAQAYLLADQANFAQAFRDTVGVGHPFGNSSRYNNMLERIKHNDKVDELIMLLVDTMETDDIPVLSKAVTNLEKTLRLIDARADRLGYLRCHHLLCIVRISLAITQAFYINCREKCWDLYKGPWTDFRKQIKCLIEEIDRQAAQSTPLFNELVKLEKWNAASQKQENPLLKLASFAKSINPASITSSRELKE